MNTFTPILGEIGIFGGLVMIAARLLPFYFLISIIPVTIGMAKTFERTGQPSWAALVPVYNMIVLQRVAGLPWYGILPILIIPFVGINAALAIPIKYLDGAADTARIELLVSAVIGGLIAFLFWITWVHHHISRRFGHGIGFTLGLTLLAPIFWLILDFGDSKYLGEQPAQA